MKENILYLMDKEDKLNNKIFKTKAKLTRLEQKRKRTQEKIDQLKDSCE
jgi:peptidoglycan hydrolase CwlO-like protein